MRAAFLSLLLVLTACGSVARLAPEVDRIEMRSSNAWGAMDVELNRNGEGRFHRSHPLPRGRSGIFAIAPAQFEALRARLERFRLEAVPYDDASAQRFIRAGCPPGLPYVTDMGAFYVRWHGPGLDQHYLADLECEPGRNAARNREIQSILESLPIPPQGRDH